MAVRAQGTGTAAAYLGFGPANVGSQQTWRTNLTGETVSLDEAPILIGRGADAAIRLDDDYVSTRHARIASSGDQWFVEDLGSTNGTYIGSHRLTQPTTLQAGSQVRIGKTTLELRK